MCCECILGFVMVCLCCMCVCVRVVRMRECKLGFVRVRCVARVCECKLGFVRVMVSMCVVNVY